MPWAFLRSSAQLQALPWGSRSKMAVRLRAFGGDGEVKDGGGLARAALLRTHRDDLHVDV